MKKILFLIQLVFFVKVSFGQDKPILIPNEIEIKYGQCDSNSVYIAELLDSVKNEGFQSGSEFYHDNVITADINNDGKCEYILRYYNGSAYTVQEIYLVNNHKLKKIFEVWGGFSWREYDQSGYPQILLSYYDGHKTNPIWKYKVLRFDGEKYKDFYSPDLTYGATQNKGLIAYKNKDYKNAEIYFRNIITVFGGAPVDINNLAITLIKQGNLDEAENLLKSELKKRKQPDTYYNLSLIYKERHDYKKELDCLVNSNKLKYSKYKLKRISELEEITK